MKIRAMYLVMLVVAIGLLVYIGPAMATHGTSALDIDGHWDNWTVNDTDNQGLKGYLFIPAFVKLECDPAAVHGPPAGFTKETGVFPAGGKGGCTEHAWEILSAWTKGGFFDPRGGTEFIPPSGDHHRSGYRTLMQMSFSGGQWLSGFAPALGFFPNYNITGLPGAGESPMGAKMYCENDIEPFKDAELNPLMQDFNGDTIKDCDDVAALAGAAIMAFVDHHGEPLTPGRFPRYIPHERQGWPSTVVTKYTASSDNKGHGISQLFHTSSRFIDGSGDDTAVTWYSMSNQSAEGCAGGWCEWFWDPATHTLCLKENATPGTKTLDANCTGGEEVTSATVVDDLGGRNRTGVHTGDGPITGRVLVSHTLNKFEKAPHEVYQKLGQWVEMDTDAATPNFDCSFTSQNNCFTHNSGDGTLEESGQAVWYEFWGLSGPNFQAEEGQDPYTWRICGDRGGAYAEEDCANAGGGGIDSPKFSGRNVHWAIVDPPGSKLGGLNPLARYGDDLRPTTGTTSCGAGGGDGDDASICGEPGVVVACTPGGVALTDDTNTPINEANIVTSDCDSDPGADGVYGTSDDGTIYYQEARENDLRGFVRENRSTAFSFINGIGVNHPELCDTDNDVSNGQDCGTSPSTGTRQVMYQNLDGLGATLSCFNCSNLAQHQVPGHDFESYSFVWTPLPGVTIPPHPATVGTIPNQ